jgi:hypothetical protein
VIWRVLISCYVVSFFASFLEPESFIFGIGFWRVVPRAAQERPRVPQELTRVPQERPKSAPRGPKSTPARPKSAQETLKSVPRSPKSAPRAPNRDSQGALERAECLNRSNQGALAVSIWRSWGTLGRSWDALEGLLGALWSRWGALGTSWGALGALLGHSCELLWHPWALLGRSWNDTPKTDAKNERFGLQKGSEKRNNITRNQDPPNHQQQ